MATTNGDHAFDTIESAIAAIRAGNPIIVLDAAHRENEGDLILAASDCTPAKTAFLIRHTSGYLCVSIPPARAAHLALPQMVAENRDPNRTAYTITVDAATDSVGTGISAQDRSETIRLLADPAATSGSFRRPGHVVPLQAREGGVRVRAGHTEAAGEFCRLAGKEPVGVLAELVEDGGEAAADGKGEMGEGYGMMRRDGCLAFGRRYGLRVVTIEALIQYLEETEGRAKG